MIKSRAAGRIKDASNVIRTLNSQICGDKCLYLVSTRSILYDSNKNAGFKGTPSVFCLASQLEGRRRRHTLESSQ